MVFNIYLYIFEMESAEQSVKKVWISKNSTRIQKSMLVKNGWMRNVNIGLMMNVNVHYYAIVKIFLKIVFIIKLNL